MSEARSPKILRPTSVDFHGLERQIKGQTAMRLHAFATAIMGLALTSQASAGVNFLGDTVSANYEWPTLGTVLYPSGTAVVGPGVEFDNVGGSGTTVDFSANNILVNYPSGWTLNGSGTFDGWVFADLSASNIVGVSLDSTNLPGFTASDLSFGPNFVRANTLGLGSWGPGTNISIDVTFGVPEPSTWAMMLLGFAGIGFAGYRSSRKGRAVSLAA